MADKSFEQQVQENLAGLRMKPDMAVWLEVERALHKERKRRWIIWLLLLAGVSGASFWVYENFTEQTPELEIIAANPVKLPIQSTVKEETAIVHEKAQDEKHKQPLFNNEPLKNVKVNSNKPLGITGTTFTQKSETSLKSTEPQTTNILPVNENKETKSADPAKVAASTPGKTALKETEPVNAGIVTQPVTDADSIRVLEEVKPAVNTPSVKNDTIPGTKQETANKKNKKNPWQWNINADAGKSGLRSGLSFSKASSDLVMATPPNNSSGNAQPTPSTTKAPTIKDAFTFGLQLEATKKIGKKSSFGISAGYLLMQNKTGVGQRVDSSTFFGLFQSLGSNGYYYRSTDSVDYTNQYHFLQLGANLYLPFTLFKAVTFRWQLGTGLNFLIATNGLHYDASTNRLFENSSLYTPIQPYFSSGLDIGIGKRPFLYIGPHWLYSFSSLSKSTSKHLTRFAVQASFVLPKKKK